MGGKPSPGTKADRRLKANNPQAGKPQGREKLKPLPKRGLAPQPKKGPEKP